jgi:hypothetical protein
MKLLSLLVGALPLATLISAAPESRPDPEAVASKRIEKLQKQYQSHINDILKPRKTGCTSKTILRRKEW